MTSQEEHDEAGTLSVQDMQKWLKDEIRDVEKARELRVKEATEFVTAYAEGKLTTEQAQERLYQYDRRWGSEALYGTTSAGVSDEEIVRRIDEARKKSLKRSINFRKTFLDR